MNAEWIDAVFQRFQARMRKDEIQIRECPYCGNPNWNFELNIHKLVFHCWVCHCHGTARNFFRDYDLSVALLPRTAAGLRERAPQEDVPVVLPPEAVPILKSDRPSSYLALRYLTDPQPVGRGLTKQEIAEYGLLYADRGKYAHRVIWPIYDGSELQYFVARRYMRKAGRRYDYPEIRRRNIVRVYPGRERRLTLVLVEGVFQVPSVHRLGYSVMPLLGTAVTNEQRRRLVARNFERYVFLLDRDAVAQSIQLASRFRTEGLDADWATTSGPDSDELEETELNMVLGGAKPPGIEAAVLASLRRL